MLITRDLLAAESARARVEIWSWVLMPNHVHLILVPADERGLADVLSRAHRRYAAFVNARARRTGHLVEERFGSAVMDEEHLMAALRYVALNPVRARLVARAQDWPWSSTRALLGLGDNGVTATAPVWDRVPRFADLLSTDAEDPIFASLRRAEANGRPLASVEFIRALETRLARPILPRKRGPKPKKAGEEN